MIENVWHDDRITTQSELVVMLALAKCHTRNGCFPSIDTLIKLTKMSRRAVCYTISRLIEKEIITKTPGGGRGRLTHYTLNYKIPPERRSKGPSFPHRLNNDASGPTPQPAKNPKPNKARPVISPLLQTPGFTQAWNDWYQYRKEIRHPMTPTSERKLLE